MAAGLTAEESMIFRYTDSISYLTTVKELKRLKKEHIKKYQDIFDTADRLEQNIRFYQNKATISNQQAEKLLKVNFDWKLVEDLMDISKPYKRPRSNSYSFYSRGSDQSLTEVSSTQ